MPVRVAETSPEDEHRSKRKRTRGGLPPARLKISINHPLGVLPHGNQYLPTSLPSIRAKGLGLLDVCDDALLLAIIGLLSSVDLLSIASCSRALRAYSRHESIWKDMYIEWSEGVLPRWCGTWRKSYLDRFHHHPLAALPSSSIEISALGLYSDALYQPYLCMQVDINAFFNTRSKSNIHHLSADSLRDSFDEEYSRAGRPVIVSDAMLQWKVNDSNLWHPSTLKARFPDVLFRAEALDCTMETYMQYMSTCSQDESPMYLFDSRFVEKTGGALGSEYRPFHLIKEDLFDLFGTERPDYRWLIIGPSRSGSTFHKDPNGTSAWNAVVSGSKGWVMFHPSVLPPGVFVNEDESEVTSPLSISEWFFSYFDLAWETYGANATDPTKRDRMLVGVCGAGEILYVPSGWWHLVVNLEETVAVTQNFVSSHEVGHVLSFFKDKPDQISGFPPFTFEDKHQSVFDRFCELLKNTAPSAFEEGLQYLEAKKRKGQSHSVWDMVRSSDTDPGQNKGSHDTGFTFGFNFGTEEEC